MLEQPAGANRDRTSPEGFVHSVETCGTVDGPGLRYVLFLSGCPLNCTYCHNPDTQGRPCGETRRVDDTVQDILRYRSFLKRGGVTVTGGEPLMQPEFVEALAEGVSAHGLHFTIDTSGVLGARASDNLLAHTDLVLLDLKAGTDQAHRALTGAPLAPVHRFARRLEGLGIPVWIRFVLVPGLTDLPEEVDRIAQFASELSNVERTEVLPFHNLGESKYQALGRNYPLAKTQPPTTEQMARVLAVFKAHGVEALSGKG